MFSLFYECFLLNENMFIVDAKVMTFFFVTRVELFTPSSSIAEVFFTITKGLKSICSKLVTESQRRERVFCHVSSDTAGVELFFK